MDCKGTNLSDVERLGECSMFEKANSIKDTFNDEIGRPKSVMVFWISFIELYTTLVVYIYYYLTLLNQSQCFNIITVKDLFQQGRQNLLPKTEIFGIRGNWGFPKRCKPYFCTWDKRYSFEQKLYGNGVSVVCRIYNKSTKGIQFITFFSTLADRRFYSSEREKKTNLVTKREIEISYKQLWDIDFLKTAYLILKSKPGNMTMANDKETLDGVSLKWAENIRESFIDRTFQFKASRRVSILKPNGKLRNLSIPSPRDKIIQQAFRMILESVFEPLFLNYNHGFRPNKSPITAIYEVRKWNGVTWIIEGDMKNYFDSINHHILAKLIRREIKDQNLIDLYWKLVKAGYVNNGIYSVNNLGVPQGGVISPLLSNIYLHEFDKFMENLINKWSSDLKIRVSKTNPEYAKIRREIKILENKEKLTEEEKEKLKIQKVKLKKVPSVIRNETTGKRVLYNRFADDWIVGISGTKEDVEKIKKEITLFLSEELKLDINENKTKISHLGKKRIEYLGFEIGKRSRKYTESQVSIIKSTGVKRRPSHASIIIYAPKKKLIEKLIDHGFAWSKTKPKAVTKWIFLKTEDIILRYKAVCRGILNYYSSVENRNLLTHITWLLKFSLVFTLARKWNISPVKVFKKLGKDWTFLYHKEKGKESENTNKEKFISFGKYKLNRNRSMKINSYLNFDPFAVKYYDVRSNHVWDENCTICGKSENVEIHHVKHIKKGKIEGFTQIMKQLNRKQIPVCRNCHMKIHLGEYDGVALKDIKRK